MMDRNILLFALLTLQFVPFLVKFVEAINLDNPAPIEPDEAGSEPPPISSIAQVPIAPHGVAEDEAPIRDTPFPILTEHDDAFFLEYCKSCLSVSHAFCVAKMYSKARGKNVHHYSCRPLSDLGDTTCLQLYVKDCETNIAISNACHRLTIESMVMIAVGTWLATFFFSS